MPSKKSILLSVSKYDKLLNFDILHSLASLKTLKSKLLILHPERYVDISKACCRTLILILVLKKKQ